MNVVCPGIKQIHTIYQHFVILVCFPYTQFTFVFTLTIFILCTWTYFGRVLSRCPNLKLADLFFTHNLHLFSHLQFLFFAHERILSVYQADTCDLWTLWDFSLFFTHIFTFIFTLTLFIFTHERSLARY